MGATHGLWHIIDNMNPRGVQQRKPMSTYTQIIYQIVFATKYRDKVLIDVQKRHLLYKYIWGILKNNHCIAYEINGVEDHLHIATHIHPSVSLSSLVKDIKISSSLWIKERAIFPAFAGWTVGYGAFTYTIKEKSVLQGYIRNQERHHRMKAFRQEYKELLLEHNVSYKDEYLFE
jgi:REP element-mobilizing transposase RayT